MSESNTSICNQSLGMIGAKRINNFEDTSETSGEAIQCRLHLEPTRDSVLQSYRWRFAVTRAVLSQDTVDPDVEWDRQFILPTDYLKFMSIDEEAGITSKGRRHSIEGRRFLTNFSTVNMKYIRKVTDASLFDPVFVELLVLRLAKKLIPALAKTDPRLQVIITEDLKLVLPKIAAVTVDELETGGRSDWNLARHGGIGISGPERLL